MNVRGLTLLLAAALLPAACTPPDVARRDAGVEAFVRVARAEDARHTVGPDLEVMLGGAASVYPGVRAAAVRGLGRLESPGLVEAIEPLLADPDPRVRAEAANALAQAVHRGDGSPALRPLLARARVEEDERVLAAVARSLGRLDAGSRTASEVGRALVALSRGPGGVDAPAERLVGVALGLESLARRTGAAAGATVAARLRTLSRRTPPEGDEPETDARIRGLALSALTAMGGTTADDVQTGLEDPSPEVRRVAATALARVPGGATGELARRALLDPWHQVRLAAVQVAARGGRDAATCARLTEAARRDQATAVRLAALDGLARPCPDLEGQVRVLTAAADGLRPDDRLGWHEAAHAVAALAVLAPPRATPLLPRFAAHSNAFVRVYAARTAGALNDVATLRTLTTDADANVRTEALVGLALGGPAAAGAARSAALAALAGADDSQLLMAAADALSGADTPEMRALVAEEAVAALARVSGSREMTRRDARMALVGLVAAVGDIRWLSSLEPYLRDWDPAVAERAASVMTEWSGDRYLAAPRPSPELPFPGADELIESERTRVVLHMARGGEIVIALHPWEAPTNAVRLMTLAGSGALDGLTLHRFAPNFVIQGLSPGANEYAGWGQYTRDEVGLPVQWRGTVGLSTRGRDTGDGQIYVNLVHNVRLDHDYTILGSVVDGMEVVDAVLEGDVVVRAELRRER